MNLSFFRISPHALAGFLALSAPFFTGAIPSASSSPTAPLRDEADVFPPEQTSTLTRILTEFSDQSHVALFVVTRHFVPEDHATAIAQEFLTAWLPDSPGLVALYSKATNRLSISGNDLFDHLFSPAEIEALIAEAVRASDRDPGQVPATRVAATIVSLASSLSDRLATRDLHAHSANHALKPLAWILAIAALGLAGLAWAASLAISRNRRIKDSFVFFPPVHVGQRFGGSFGGGTVAQIGSSLPSAHYQPQTQNAPARPTIRHAPSCSSPKPAPACT